MISYFQTSSAPPLTAFRLLPYSRQELENTVEGIASAGAVRKVTPLLRQSSSVPNETHRGDTGNGAPTCVEGS
jgi:hypothetical protein